MSGERTPETGGPGFSSAERTLGTASLASFRSTSSWGRRRERPFARKVARDGVAGVLSLDELPGTASLLTNRKFYNKGRRLFKLVKRFLTRDGCL